MRDFVMQPRDDQPLFQVHPIGMCAKSLLVVGQSLTPALLSLQLFADPQNLVQFRDIDQGIGRNAQLGIRCADSRAGRAHRDQEHRQTQHRNPQSHDGRSILGGSVVPWWVREVGLTDPGWTNAGFRISC